jgi:hypothetical protein
MKFSSSAVAIAAILSFIPNNAVAFTPGTAQFKSHTLSSGSANQFKSITRNFATVEDEKTETEEEKKDAMNAAPEVVPDAEGVEPDTEGLPWWWDLVWKLDVMQTTEQGTDCTFGDSANVLRTNIEQIYGGYPSLDGCPLAEGELSDMADGTQFVGLQRYSDEFGSPYKLCFGPKSFLVISDPVQAKHVLKDANVQYDKGLLGGKCTIHCNMIASFHNSQKCL